MTVSDRAAKARRFFSRARAEDYEPRAMGRSLWAIENREIWRVLSDLPGGTSVLDVPVGTGRFLELYRELGFDVIGIDASPAMLERARSKPAAAGATLMQGDIFETGLPSDAVDVVIAVRIFHLIEHADFMRAIAELQRVARSRIVATIRLGEIRSPCWGPERAAALQRSLGEWRILEQTHTGGDWYLLELGRC